LYLCLWNTKKHSKTLVGAPIEFETTQHTKNEEDMELQLEREGSKALFSKKIEANYHSSSSCVFCVAPLPSDAQRTFVTIWLAHPMTQDSLNLVTG